MRRSFAGVFVSEKGKERGWDGVIICGSPFNLFPNVIGQFQILKQLLSGLISMCTVSFMMTNAKKRLRI